MPYTKQTWTDYDSATPISAARLTHLEDGVLAAGDPVAETAARLAADNAESAARAAADTAHLVASDPHGDRADAAAQVVVHTTATDPHGDRAAAVTDATARVTAHTVATDPHGDRADAASKYVPTVRAQVAESTPITFAKVVPVTTGHAPFEWRYSSFSNHFTIGGIDAQTVPNAGDYNHALHWGYNPGRHNGGAVVAGVPGWFLGMEDRWPDPEGDGTTGSEFYLEYTSPDGTSVPTSVLRPLYIRLKNAWDNTASNKSVQAFFDIGQGPTGSFGVWGGIQNGHQVMSVSQSTFATFMPTSAHLGNFWQLSPLSGQASALIKAPGAASSPVTGANDYIAVLAWQVGSATKWSLMADSNPEFILIDQTAGRQHGYFLSGADSKSALSQFKSKMIVEGILSVGSATTTPTLATTANSGTSPPTPTITGNASRGLVDFGTGSGSPTAGAQVTVTLPSGYTGNPVVVIAAGNYQTAVKVPYVIQPGDAGLAATQFQVCLLNPAVSQATGTYRVAYTVIG